MNSSGGYPEVQQTSSFVGLLFVVTIAFSLAGCCCCGPEQAPKTISPPRASAREPSPSPTNEAASLRPASTNWQSLFDGKTLKGWTVTDFAGRGEVRVHDGRILLEMGVMTGITWTNPILRMNYEVELDAMRVEGSDFFCGLTFPVGEAPCSLIVGGWGGGVVGLSSLDGEDAANNETTQYINFERGRWYRIRLRVMPTKIQAWIDEDKVVDVVTTDRKISIRSEVELSRPFGIATWSTTGALRNIRIRAL
jgi:3-keto-disaccharide hydrolase